MSNAFDPNRGGVPQYAPQPPTYYTEHGQQYNPSAQNATVAAAAASYHQPQASPGSATVNVNDLTPTQMRQILSNVHRSDPTVLSGATAPVLGLENGGYLVIDQQEGAMATAAAAAEQSYGQAGTEDPWNKYEASAEDETQREGGKSSIVSRTSHRERPSKSEDGEEGSASLSKKMAWQEKFAELALHKAQHGTCHVSSVSGGGKAQLSRWVNTQRRQYRLKKAGQPSSLTEERIAMLEGIGIDWKFNPDKIGKTATGRKKTWDDWMADLRAYKAEKGDCDVPQKVEGGLGLFVAKQRQNYRLWREGKPTSMTPERAAALEAEGFAFTSRRFNPHTPWDERLQELKKYKEEHGNCLVKAGKGRDGSYSQLGKWVDHQRQQKRLHALGKASSMTKERIQALDDLGFEWIAPRRVPKPRKRKPEDEASSESKKPKRSKEEGGGSKGKVSQAERWEQRLQELTKYREEFGHTRVKAGKGREGSYDKLGKWVDHQRQLFRLRKEGKPSSMNMERIQRLEALDFEWVLVLKAEPIPQVTKAKRGRPRKKVDKGKDKKGKSGPVIEGPPLSIKTPWSERLEELRNYKQEYGHCRVRAGKGRDGSYSQLGKWVDHQRQLYRLRNEGKPSSMTEERIKALEDLGFEWVIWQRAPKKDDGQKDANLEDAKDDEGMKKDESAEGEEFTTEDNKGAAKKDEISTEEKVGEVPETSKKEEHPATDEAVDEDTNVALV